MGAVKARDIIPGWPKGRSTMAISENLKWRDSPKWRFYWDDVSNLMYHQAQAQMVAEFLASEVYLQGMARGFIRAMEAQSS